MVSRCGVCGRVSCRGRGRLPGCCGLSTSFLLRGGCMGCLGGGCFIPAASAGASKRPTAVKFTNTQVGEGREQTRRKVKTTKATSHTLVHDGGLLGLAVDSNRDSLSTIFSTIKLLRVQSDDEVTWLVPSSTSTLVRIVGIVGELTREITLG